MDVYLGAADGATPPKIAPDNNKLGGLPDWPARASVDFDERCDVCGLARPLLVQCYALHEDSPYHRTLYVFACINPNCWNNPRSWTCIRVQYPYLDDVHATLQVLPTAPERPDQWCTEADDWEENNFNGNQIGEENEDMEEIINGTENMKCTDVHSRLAELQQKMRIIDRASAEIEVENPIETVIVEQFSMPKCDLNSILNRKPDLPVDLKSEHTVQFNSMYIKVYTEFFSYDDNDRIKELLQKYESENEKVVEVNTLKKLKVNKKANQDYAEEEYEKGIPLHGDALFHSFLNNIRMNPDQILRYSLGGQPMLVSQLQSNPELLKCEKCHGNLQFEFQILPTIIPLLKLSNSQETHLEFGTALIWTCKKSCWSEDSKYCTEIVILQSEPH